MPCLTTAQTSSEVETARLDVLARGAARLTTQLLTEVAPSVVVNLAVSESPITPSEPWVYDRRLADTLATSLKRWHDRGGRCKHFIVLSATAVYGVARTSPLLFDEAADRKPDEPDLQESAARWAQGLARAESKLAEVAHGLGCKTCVLRAAPVVGGPVESPVSQYLSATFPVRVLGYDPPVQVIHYRDLVAALLAAVEQQAEGVMNIVGRGVVPLSRLTAGAGVFAPALPGAIADYLAPRALGSTRLRWRCVADGRLAKQVLGFSAAHGAMEAVNG